MRLAAGALLALLALVPEAAARAEAPAAGSVEAAVGRATREGKPILLFSRPPVCRAPKRTIDPCTVVEFSLLQPAVSRRLGDIVFTKLVSSDATPSVTVLDPGGEPLVRWGAPPDIATFRQMLTLVDGASRHVVASYRAREAGDATRAAQERCLALFALGDEVAGRGQLDRLDASPDEESRQLALVWRSRLDEQSGGSGVAEVRLSELARGGASDRVEFEAWMALGDRLAAAKKTPEAVAAYHAALELAPESGPGAAAAQAALARSSEAAVPLIGLGAPGSIVAGMRTIQPRWSATGVARVEYRLDGKVVATAAKPPFAAAVRFDRVPTRRMLEVVAYDASGNAVRSASAVVNDRSEAFAIQIVSPAAETLAGASEVELSVRVPRGRAVAEVVVEWNGAVAARLDAPPWKAEVTADAASLGILRAVVRLDDGQEREDVRVFNAGPILLGAGVHLVEVPVNSANRSLKPADLVVKEGGEPRAVDRVIAAADASLDVALLLDMSTSISEHVLDLEEAAIQFVGRSLEERARVTVVAFDTAARVVLWPTSDRARIERAIEQLRVRGATAVNDAIITSILQFQAGGSRRAIVVLSDGLDNASIFSMAEVLEVAKRNAVPVYAVIVNPAFQAPPGRTMPTVPPEAKAQRELARLARSSGGMAFELRDAGKAGAIWQKVADDLRNQSLVVYRTRGGAAGWRKLDVSLRAGGAIRAPEGVFIDAGGAGSEGDE